VIREVRRLPDHVLKEPAAPVDPADPAVVALADDLVDTMRVSPGCVGLAAPQIGVSLRVFSMDVTGHRKARSCTGLVVLANPVLVSAEDPRPAREGCMSVPDFTGDVRRPFRVTMTGVLPGSGEPVTVDADAIEARALLHELDHLDGLLFLDRVAGPHAVFDRKRYL
jgi:peptide deformylase